MKKILFSLIKLILSNKHDIIRYLRSLNANMLTNDQLSLIEAGFRIGDISVRDIMIPRHEIEFIDIDITLSKLLEIINDTGHSRFPVIDKSFNEVKGIFHIKDLLQYYANDNNKFHLYDYIRKVYFIPEIKKIDNTLYEMRKLQAQIAIVVDEFTNMTGLITLEMLIEQIVGQIDDEYDHPEDMHGITLIKTNKYRIEGSCRLNYFNNTLKLNWKSDELHTVSGFIIKYLDRIPISGEHLKIFDLEIDIISADNRKINLLMISLTNAK